MMKAIRFLLRWFLARPGAVFLTGFGLAVVAAALDSAPGTLIALEVGTNDASGAQIGWSLIVAMR